MTKQEKINTFDPNAPAIKNGNFMGLPFDENDADIIFLPVPWDATVSFGDGTATAPQNILKASYQIDLVDPFVQDAWKAGFYMMPVHQKLLKKNNKIRTVAIQYIDFLENGGHLDDHKKMKKRLRKINKACQQTHDWVYEQTKALLQKGKLVGVVGGDHSTPLGYLKALAEQYDAFGILQIDAHMDLRKAYEGFTYSHASIFYNALKIEHLSKLVQVGIRDWCEEELQVVQNAGDRITVFYDHQMKEALYFSQTFAAICEKIVAALPQQVYISLDIDGLDPQLCPHTGTPVPGGLQFSEAIFLIQKLVESGRKVIGFDLCEVAGVGNDWDGNVAARILYRMANLASNSWKIT